MFNMLTGNKKSSTNLLLLGMVAGVAAGVYLARRFSNSDSMMNENANQNNQTNQVNQTNRSSQSMDHTNHTEKSSTMESSEGFNSSGKEELFKTFLNGTEEELMKKASDMDIKN